MDLEKISEFITDHSASWTYNTFFTLRRPVARFKEIHINPLPEPQGFLYAGEEHEKEGWISSDLVGFVVVSLLVGVVINSLIPGRVTPPEMMQSVLIAFLYWVLGACITFCFCKLMFGKGSFLETLNVYLQLSATLFVVTSFGTFLIVTFLKYFGSTFDIGGIPYLGAAVLGDPTNIYFIVGTLFSIFYLPMAMKAVHHFGWLRTSLIALIPLTTVVLSQAIYKETGVLVNINSLMPM